MNNKILMAIAGFNLGVIGMMLILGSETLFFNYLIAAVVGSALAGIGYFVGGMLD